jgi:hypothetical protein
MLIKLWATTSLMIFTPIILGCFVVPLFNLGFTVGAVFVGFYLSTSTTTIAGILESAKDWVVDN